MVTSFYFTFSLDLSFNKFFSPSVIQLNDIKPSSKKTNKQMTSSDLVVCVFLPFLFMHTDTPCVKLLGLNYYDTS